MKTNNLYEISKGTQYISKSRLRQCKLAKSSRIDWYSNEILLSGLEDERGFRAKKELTVVFDDCIHYCDVYVKLVSDN